MFGHGVHDFLPQKFAYFPLNCGINEIRVYSRGSGFQDSSNSDRNRNRHLVSRGLSKHPSNRELIEDTQRSTILVMPLLPLTTGRPPNLRLPNPKNITGLLRSFPSPSGISTRIIKHHGTANAFLHRSRCSEVHSCFLGGPDQANCETAVRHGVTLIYERLGTCRVNECVRVITNSTVQLGNRLLTGSSVLFHKR
ncbi:unnamed protein product, partial [Nesidiocoris tenuis]